MAQKVGKMVMEIDLTEGPGDSVIYEAAYTRILNILRGNFPFVNSLLLEPWDRPISNWKLTMVRKSREIKTLRELWNSDADFRVYLKERLESHFGNKVERLIQIFIL